MNFSEDLLQSLKDGDLIKIRAELIGCLDDDEISSEPPCTLKMAEMLSEKLGDKLFEIDNGHCDFNAPLTEDTLMSVKSRLTMNFSKEKLEFACQIIQSLKAQSLPVKQAKAVPAKTVEAVQAKTTDTILAKSVDTVLAKPADTVLVKTVKEVSSEIKEKNTANSNVASEVQPLLDETRKAEWPTNMPNAAKPIATKNNPISKDAVEVSSSIEGMNVKAKNSTETTSQCSSKIIEQTSSSQNAVTPQEKSFPRLKPKFKPHYQGFWERLFGFVGRRMDNFFKMLFGR